MEIREELAAGSTSLYVKFRRIPAAAREPRAV